MQCPKEQNSVPTKGLILAVDDSRDSLQLLTTILENDGYEVHSALSGSLALRSAEIQRPDLVLLDAVMPGMDGYEFCRRFKAQADNRDVPVIFVSASSDTGEKLKGFAAGAVDYVTKPFWREELLARVRIHLELYRLRHKLEDLVEERTRSLQESESKINRVLRVLSEGKAALIRAVDEHDLFLRMCEVVVNTGGYRFAWVAIPNQDAAKTVYPLASAGFDDGFLGEVQITWGDEPTGRGPTGTAIRTGMIQIVDDAASAPTMTMLRESALKRGYRSSISLPLKDEAGVLGCLVIAAGESSAFGPAEVELLQDLAENISFGVLAIRERQRRQESEERYRALFDHMQIGFTLGEIVHDDAGRAVDCRFLAVNPAFLAGHGLRQEDVVGKRLTEVYPYADVASVDWIDVCTTVAATGKAVHFEVMRQASNQWDEVTVYRPAPNQVAILSNEISDRKRSEARLQLAATVFTHAREGIVIAEADGTIVDVNRMFSHITGYEREEVIGQPLRILKSGRHSPQFYAAMRKSLAEKGHWYGEIWDRRKDGEIYPASFTISAVRDDEEATCNYVAMFTDIKTIKEHQQQLEHVAYHDILTNLPNRLLLADRLRQGIVQTQRRGEALAVAYLDLDGFKEINDRYGHNTGDELLVGLAGQMEAVLREGDTLARIGGDEFVAILGNLKRPQDCVPLLERILSVACTPVTVGGTVLRVSASIGAALCPQDGTDADHLIRQADQAMYLAKQAGRNCYRLFDRNQANAAQAQSESVKQLRQALERREFVLHYQPKVNMRTGTVIGVEALIRWQHPERGLLLPAAFLPTTEDHPVGIEIGEWVIDAALVQAAEWRRAGLELPVSVNVSALQLQQGDFTERLSERLRAHPDVPPSWLELEILETSALADIGTVSALMWACKEMGVRFALDDFGTGYSSLTYLRRLPAELLKIDQTFVRDMLKDKDDLAIVNGVVGLAKAFGRKVIAEGIETTHHGKVLLSLGCDLAQGYGIAKPMPAADMPGWIVHWLQDPARHWTALADPPS